MGYISYTKAKEAIHEKLYKKERHVRVMLIAPEGTYIDGEELLTPMEIWVELPGEAYEKTGGKIKIGTRVRIHDLIDAYIEKVLREA